MNLKLATGLAIALLMLAVALTGPVFAPHTLKDQAKIEYVIGENGHHQLIVPPVAPNKTYPFGTDKMGYDLLTEMLHGAKYTVFASFAIALFRVLFGGTLGLYYGYYRERSPIQADWSALNGIPVFLVIYFVMMGITVNSSIRPYELTVILGTAFVLIGIPSVFGAVRGKTAEVKKKLYILAAHSLGASKSRILFRHILPHLKESLLVLFVNEMMLALAIFGQLSLFGMYVGGSTFNPHDEPAVEKSITHEWAGMVGTARMNVYVDHWILLFPLAAYMLLIIGFYLISRGLEAKYREQYSRSMHI